MKESLTHRYVMQKALLLTALITVGSTAWAQSDKHPPNVVMIFLDDSGYADFRPFGQPNYPTPHVSQLAQEGCCYTNFHVPQAICSASRACLLTGCYPGRTRVFSAFPPKVRGLDPKFSTLGEMFKSRGYATALFGKWHLGDQPDTRPAARGFDESCGLMVSNDMWRHHPENPDYWGQFPLPYWENNQITIPDITPEHQTHLTTWYTEKAVQFIHTQKTRPFFLYVPHSMPHVPIYCSSKFRGKSGAGLYGDVMMELDWSVGQIMQALKTEGVEDNTIVLFTSDNGPWHSYGNHAGRTPFREAKGTGFDGGTRSACIIKYPGHIPAGTLSDRAFCSVDILPTLAHVTGTPLPANPIDGMNVWDLVRGVPGTTNPHDYYPFSTDKRFEGVLSGDGHWKLHLPHPYRVLVSPGMDGMPGKYKQEKIALSLFDMNSDPYETTNALDQYPEVAQTLEAYAEAHKQAFYEQ